MGEQVKHYTIIVSERTKQMFVEKWYLVLYQIKGQTVYIDYIIDCRQDYRWLLK